MRELAQIEDRWPGDGGPWQDDDAGGAGCLWHGYDGGYLVQAGLCFEVGWLVGMCRQGKGLRRVEESKQGMGGRRR